MLRIATQVNTSWLIAVALIYMAGCDVPGNGYFSAELVGEYSVHRSSDHEIEIATEGWIDKKPPSIPSKVIECVVHQHLTLAKRQGLQRRSPNNPKDTYMEPDPAAFDYWILDTKQPKVFGPMSLAEFNIKREKLEIPASVKLRDVDSFRPRKKGR
jgi:hypothetical protein